MQEIELKFQIPNEALSAVRAELQALAGAALTPLALRAAYFDTPDRRLAQARSALRVRQEGDAWVQTLKAAGSHTMLRVEDNQAAAAPSPGQPIVADLARHLGTPAETALRQALGWTPETDPNGSQTGLVALYSTDITRWRVRLTVGRGTPHEGEVELALDLGHIEAGALRLAVQELEIEALSGSPMAVIDIGRDWVHRHGLWLDTQTKAHRGDRLARLAASTPARRPGAELADAGRATQGRAARVTPDASRDTLWRVGVEACLEQISANMSELASLAPTDPGPAAYEWRRGLRRLRALGHLLEKDDRALPKAAMTRAANLSRHLGWWRDQAVHRALPDQLVADGGPALPLPSPPAPEDAPASQVALARSEAATGLCLDLLEALMQPTATPCDAQPARRWLARRLRRQQARLTRQAQAFKRLDVHQRHRLRQQLRQLRDVAELYAPMWPDKGQARHAQALGKVLSCLGALQDDAVALSWYHDLAAHEPRAAFACGWLKARLRHQAQHARHALKHWMTVRSPW